MSFRLTLLGLVPVLACGAYWLDAMDKVTRFCTGPGSYSRIFAAVLLAWNWKSLPFAWTVRIVYSMVLHLWARPFHNHTPDKLFHPVISESHAALNEIDYRFHKSNSTYLADVDIARSHLASHLLARSGHLAYRNAKTRFVMDPSDPSRPARGPFNIAVGGVYCSWKREIKPYQKYEMWTRVLSWDRKWLYIMTHFVEKGAVKPRSWDAENFGPTRTTAGEARDWEKKVFATAVSLYLFKVGRLTIHPAIMLQGSGLLPERPGGWISNPDDAGSGASWSEESTHSTLGRASWQWIERERKRGLEYAQHLTAMNSLHTEFDGGENGALGRFPLG